MMNNLIGEDAGIIWNILYERGSLSVEELAKMTGYRELYVYLALGWLSRESKIRYFEKEDELIVKLSSE